MGSGRPSWRATAPVAIRHNHRLGFQRGAGHGGSARDQSRAGRGNPARDRGGDGAGAERAKGNE